jgi:hypothetical protein
MCSFSTQTVRKVQSASATELPTWDNFLVKMCCVFDLVQFIDASVTSVPIIVFVFLNWLPLLNTHPDAPAESQADVLLGALPQFSRPQDVLP